MPQPDRPPQSPALSPVEHHRDAVVREISIMDVELTNLEQLCDVIMSNNVSLDQNL